MELNLLLAAMAAAIFILYLLEYRLKKVTGMIRGINYMMHIGIVIVLFYKGMDLEYVLLFLLISLFISTCRREEIWNDF